jgi:hypothetical protein
LPEGVTVETLDAFQNVAETKPIHLPHIWNSCFGKSPCVLNETTVSENVYDLLDDKLDPGFTLIAATEIRVKFKSRQSIIEATSDQNASKLDFRKTDPPSVCQSINQAIYKDALELVEPRRLEFYKKYGTPMVFVEDKTGAVPAGPLWIYDHLKFDMKKNSTTGVNEMQVQSVGFVTQLDTIFNLFSPYVAGFHYCKLISPARVLEWVYTDSLKEKLGWNAPRVSYVLPLF